MRSIKPGTWLEDLIEVYNDLGGIAAYRDVYAGAQARRQSRGASWTPEAEASVRRTVEDHAASSANFRGRSVFYSVNGHGRGVWGLMPDYLRAATRTSEPETLPAYLEGPEGILREVRYLMKSRDPRIAEQRKLIDDFTCQVCRFRLMVDDGRYVIDVHHLNPLGALADVTVTSVEDLVCLCPTCHRIAHINKGAPLSLIAIASKRGIRLAS